MAVVAFPLEASAFRTAGDLQKYSSTPRVAWESPVVKYELHQAVPAEIGVDGAEHALRAAFDAWSAPDCAVVRADYFGLASRSATPGDRANTVEFVFSGWQARGFDPTAAGVTDVQYARTGDGPWWIVEADIYINADGVTFATGTSDGGSAARHLDAVLTHEAGHALGLLHPCEVSADVDLEAPLCSSNASYRATTMYPTYRGTESTLSADDEAGICFLYPKPELDSGLPDGGLPTEYEPCDGGAVIDKQCVPLGGGSPSAGIPCVADDMCRDTEQCRAGHCQAILRPGGDSCSESSECGSGNCEGDHCTAACSAALECADGQSCVTGSCSGASGPIGAACKDASECAGGRCIAGGAKTPVCTRVCGAHLAACPEGWSCGSVASEPVCIPPDSRPQASGGCAVTHSSTEGFPASFLAALAAVGSLSLVRARRRVLALSERSVRYP